MINVHDTNHKKLDEAEGVHLNKIVKDELGDKIEKLNKA
jgi:hypothetical protein